jgi:3-methyladenine DNA glycosylase AlkD
MEKNSITMIEEIRKELKEQKQNRQNTVKSLTEERPDLYRLRSPIVRKISQKYFSRVKGKPKEEIFQLCEELLETGYSEERTIAFDWAFRLKKKYDESDFSIFELWLKKHVNGWGSCDDFCVHALGEFIFQFPQYLQTVTEWTESDNLWMRRASAVVMIYSIRRDKYLESIFTIADSLLEDKDLMVQKGYGWMLKEASNKYPREVFQYVMAHKNVMPRTALRYAIEKLSPELRKKAMAKNFEK